ncbi:HEAT repeat domain-containing protein, partial [Streptomyces rochei]|nr:MerR family transcriptional regulator [Streptomyces rochei]
IAALPETPAASEALAEVLGDADPTVRGQAALALGGRGVGAAVPALVGMVVEGVNDVDAAEVLGALSRDPDRAERIMAALVGELAAPSAGPATRIRLAQALVELSGDAPLEVLRGLARDDDRAVALVASAFVGVLDKRSAEDRGDPPPVDSGGDGRPSDAR